MEHVSCICISIAALPEERQMKLLAAVNFTRQTVEDCIAADALPTTISHPEEDVRVISRVYENPEDNEDDSDSTSSETSYQKMKKAEIKPPKLQKIKYPKPPKVRPKSAKAQARSKQFFASQQGPNAQMNRNNNNNNNNNMR